MPLPMNIIVLAMKLMQNRDLLNQIKDKLPDLKPAPESEYPVGSCEWLQESLNELIDAGLDVDGEYGPLTKNAVADYQKQNGLKLDGWAGPETINHIVSDLA
jgi:peptidoglycan hydrolase-like protein with peptidoglycan-binding domain